MNNSRRALRRVALPIVTLIFGFHGPWMLAEEAQTGNREIEPSVVKIIVRSSPPDLISPWQKAGIANSSGSGVIIEGNRILTNAHVVDDAVSIEVKRSGTSERHTARVEFVGHDCDLALLSVDDESFFEGALPVAVGDMPRSQDPLQVYGFPIGGETLSVTSGIMSRVEVSTYVHSVERLLLAQVDAAINVGNSGGPVIAGGAIVGIAFQGLEEAENVGDIIPAPVIEHFLDDVTDGRYDGFPRLGVEFQDLESPAHRVSLGMAVDHSGALVGRVDHGGPAHGVLRTGDVLVAIDDLPVGNDMTVDRATLGRVDLSDVFRAKQMGDTVALSVLRDGERVDFELELTPHQALIPGRRGGDAPEYLVFGGLVFQPLTIEYLGFFEVTPHDLVNLVLYQNVVTERRRQVVLIQKVLPHAVNRGYQDWEDYVVETVNGVPLQDMEHLAQLIDHADGPWLKVVTADGSYLTISVEEARSAQESILGAFGVAADRSPDLVRQTLTAQAQ